MPTGKASVWINGQRLTLTVSAEGPCSAFLATGEEGGGVSILIYPYGMGETLEDPPEGEED